MLIVPESLPERAEDDFGPFHSVVRQIVASLKKIEDETEGDQPRREAECARIASICDTALKVAKKRQTFSEALTAALIAPSEEAARRKCFEEYYDSASDFLAAASDFDRQDRLTWVGRVSSFHHSEFGPRFHDAASVFANAVAARAAWRADSAHLLALLAGAFPFTLQDFARAANGQPVSPKPVDGLDEIRELIDGMNVQMERTGVDVFAILKNGMAELSSRLSDLRKQWYRPL